jgi:hypothetical protein
MPKHLLIFIGLCLLMAGLSVPARAEGLEDAFIRALYTATAAAVGDPEKTRQLLEENLDEYFTRKSNLTQVIIDTPPQKTTSTRDKIEVIDDVVRGYSVMRVERYKSKIVSIKYTDDRQYATVTYTTASSGTISLAVPGDGYKAAKYEDGEGCVDQLGLEGTKIKILQSACNEKIVVKK